jgi:hypothetical protein
VSIPFKPHSAMVYTVTQAGKTKERGSALATVLCQVTPMTANAAYNQFNLEVKRPHLLMCDTADESNFQIGYEVVWNSRDWVVKATMPFSGINGQDHVSVLLEVIGNA